MAFIDAVTLNVLCSALGFMVNIFYVSCLVCPSGRTTNIKQPLLTLLVLMIFCSGLFQVSMIIYLILDVSNVSFGLKQSMGLFMYYAIRVSMPTTLWLNIFYCTQIVPGQNALYVWFKKNIRIIVYLIIMCTKIYFLFKFIVELLLSYGQTPGMPNGNSTSIFGSFKSLFDEILEYLDIMTMVLIFLGLTTMLIVNSATVCYLYQHIMKMTKSGKGMNSQVLLNQVRVTVTGLIQGLLYLICTSGLFMDLYCIYYGYHCNPTIIWTIFTVYSLCTTLNLGVGQSLFRQRFMKLCRKGETSESEPTE